MAPRPARSFQGQIRPKGNSSRGPFVTEEDRVDELVDTEVPVASARDVFDVVRRQEVLRDFQPEVPAQAIKIGGDASESSDATHQLGSNLATISQRHFIDVEVNPHTSVSTIW